MTTCPLCNVNSPRYCMTQDCCQLRYYAQMPNHRLAAVAKNWTAAERDEWRVKIADWRAAKLAR